MYRNILKLTIRNLYRNKLYSIISILGLTIGITVFLSIFSVVNFEYGFNQNIPGGSQIYRIYTQFSGNFVGTNRGISNGIPAYVEKNFTGIADVAHFHTWAAPTKIIQPDGSGKSFDVETNLVIADTHLFTLFPIWEWQAGSLSAMDQPGMVVLLQSQATKYFGDLPSSEYLGREVIYQDSLHMQVGGIVSDPEERTDLQFTDFLSSRTIESSFLKDRFDNDDWDGTSSSDQFFLKLEKGTSEQDLSELLATVSREKESRSQDDSWTTSYVYQPLSELHYQPAIGTFDITSHAADPSLLKNLFLIALAILLIAIINFINLETAIGSRRSREIGIRKVLGSSRKNVMMQFLMQSVFMTLIAVLLTIPLVYACLNYFSDFLPPGLVFEPMDPSTLLMLLVLVLITGLFAGFYPSQVLSSYNPATVLKSNAPMPNTAGFAGYLRRGLTVFQFTFSQILLIVTFIIFNQISFMLHKEIGFRPDNVLYFSTPGNTDDSKREVLDTRLHNIAGVSDVTRFSSLPMASGWSSNFYDFVRENGTTTETEVFLKYGDSTFADFFGIDRLSGRPLRNDKEIYINETYMHILGFEDPDAVIDLLVDTKDDSLTVAGVVRDFNFRSLHTKIKPLAIRLDPGNSFAVRLTDKNNASETVATIRRTFATVYPDSPFSSQYYISTIQGFYQSEKRTSDLISVAAGIALLISCLGLFGLTSFMSLRRTREIGIRKVQGASVRNILQLLTTDFLKLVIISIILAIPLAYWAGQTWLEDFAYKAPVHGWIFLITTIIAVMIAFLTVSYHALSAAKINPVECLRTE